MNAFLNVMPLNINIQQLQLRSGEIFEKKKASLSRSCDSRNLNLEPLCTLERGPLPKLWLTEASKAFFCVEICYVFVFPKKR